MNRDSLETLLDRVYELEGLVHLALTRDDIPERLQSLITRKGQRIAETIAAGGEEPEPTPPIPAHHAVESPVVSEPCEEKPDAEVMPRAEEIETEGWDDVEDQEHHATADVASVRVHEIIEEMDEPEQDLPAPDENPGEPEEDLPEPDEEPDEAEEDMPEEDTVAAHSQISQSKSEKATPLRSRFSLNDRFRFSRELFSGNTRRFDETVRLLDSLTTFDEAEDYIIVQLGWDPEADDAAAEFVDIVRTHFND